MLPGDAVSVAALTAELGYSTTAGDIVERVTSLAGSSSSAAFVIEIDGTVAGWIHVGAYMSLESGPVAEIAGLVVTERRRGQGLGHALVAEAEAWARAKGHRRFRVRSNVTREATRRFYEGLGFQVTKQQRVFDRLLD